MREQRLPTQIHNIGSLLGNRRSTKLQTINYNLLTIRSKFDFYVLKF